MHFSHTADVYSARAHTHIVHLHTWITCIHTHSPQVIYLTSLLEMSVVDMTHKGAVSKIDIETEPSFCGLGPEHAAIGMNNQVRTLKPVLNV